MLGAYIFTMFMSSWWILPLSIMKWPSDSLFMVIFLKSILSDMSIATPAFFFYCPFSWNICFHAFTCSLCKSFVLRWVSGRQHMCGSCFLIHSALLCVLIGAFNPFTFKVIIDMYLFIVIFFLPVFLSLSLFLPFLKAVPVASLAELVWWRYILLDFFFVSESPYLAFYLVWEPCWVKWSWLQASSFHYLEYFLPFSSGLELF